MDRSGSYEGGGHKEHRGGTLRSWDFAELQLHKEILRGGHKKVGGALSAPAKLDLMTPPWRFPKPGTSARSESREGGLGLALGGSLKAGGL